MVCSFLIEPLEVFTGFKILIYISIISPIANKKTILEHEMFLVVYSFFSIY